MAVILETIPAVPNPPIPNQSSAKTAFANDYSKMAAGLLSSRDRKAISVLGLVRELKAVRGIDYTNNDAALIQDAQVFSGGIPMIDLDTAFAVLDWNNGKLADGTLPSDLAGLQVLARTLRELPEERLNRLMILLEARLAE